MYCFRCGKQLPPRGLNCPVCDTLQKRRSRRRHRLLFGLFIFLAGAFVGSLVDGVFFKGKSWDHSFLQALGLRRIASDSLESSDTDGRPVVSESGAVLYHDARTTKPSLPARLADEPTSNPHQKGPSDALGAAQGQGYSRLQPGQPVPSALQPPTQMAAVSPELATSSGSAVVVGAGKGNIAEAVASVASPVSAASGAAVAPVAPAAAPAVSVVQTDSRPLAFASAEPLVEGKGNHYHGSLSADSQMMVFSSNSGADDENRFQPYMREMDGRGASAKLFPWAGNVWTPEFSRDGRFLVFSSDSQAKEHIFRHDRTSQQSKALTTGSSKNMMPAISPDGKFVAFVSDRKGNNDIWMVGIDGKELVQITSGAEDDREPRWYPDGKSLIFTRVVEKLKDSRLMRVSLDPVGSPEEIVAGKTRNWMADISPDGRYIAYVRSKGADGSGNEIHVRRIEGGSEFLVNPIKGGEHYRPIWSPDGESLVFHIDRANKKSLYLAKLKRVDAN
ncbi:MAG: hypothetical protein WA705_13475 [Candidatus Ozemobacteraceae bacterium]